MAYWLSLDKRLVIWDLLKAGNSIRQVERATHVHRNTIMRFRQWLLARAEWRRAEGLDAKANN